MVSLLPSADGNQRCHFKEKGRQIAAPEVSMVLLQTGLAEEWFKTHIFFTRDFHLLTLITLIQNICLYL